MAKSLEQEEETVFMDNVNIRHMDNVNMPVGKTPYHHGDLRANLVEIAVSFIEKDGVSKLSLRRIASQAGVSHNAPYMHFPNKDALLEEVVAHGFAQLRSDIAAAGGRETLTISDWYERVKRGFRAYVAFAQQHPNLYALMHAPLRRARSDKQPEPGKPDTTAPGNATLQGLVATLEAGQKLGTVSTGNAKEMALWVWSTLHGLASLTSEDRLAFEGRSKEAVCATVLDNLLLALGRAPADRT